MFILTTASVTTPEPTELGRSKTSYGAANLLKSDIGGKVLLRVVFFYSIGLPNNGRTFGGLSVWTTKRCCSCSGRTVV